MFLALADGAVRVPTAYQLREDWPCWVVRPATWHPVSVLDVGALIPVPEVEPVPRSFPTPDWHAMALCNGMEDADVTFFGGEEDEEHARSPRVIERARSICRACPAAVECLTWALSARNQQADDFVAIGERFGIWAGTTGRQRARMQQRIRAGETVAELVDEWLDR